MRNPLPAVDLIIEVGDRGIVLVERRHPPKGWALPGGFVDVGEDLASAARREAREETGLDVELLEQFFTYSDPQRDPRQHVLSTVFLGRVPEEAQPAGADDARQAVISKPLDPPGELVFDHARILDDYLRYRRTGQRRVL